MSAADPAVLGQALLDAWVHQGLDTHADADQDPLEWDRRVGRIFCLLDPDEPQLHEVEYLAQDERSIRRWCWATHWLLLSQDEDLMVMSETFDPWLLEEAVLGCPKSEYVRNIVAHSVRDTLHAALWAADPPGRDSANTKTAVDGQLDRACRLARNSGVGPECEYYQRLASYRNRGKVSKAQARQRVLDVRRCHPHSDVPVELSRRGKLWRASFIRASTIPGELFIDARDGSMWAVSGGP